MENQELTTFVNLVKAGTRVIQIISYETLRIHAMLVASLPVLKRSLYLWNRIDGIRSWHSGEMAFTVENEDVRDFEAAYAFFIRQKNIIMLFEDIHCDLTDSHPETIRRIRNIAFDNKPNKTCVLSQPYRFLPRELEKEAHIFELPYPQFEDIAAIYGKVCREFKIPGDNKPPRALIEAALGLTIMEAEKAFSLAYIESNALGTEQVSLIIREKENVIKKSGYLEYVHPKEGIKDIGGLDNLKDWIIKRGKGFDAQALEYGLTYPKGVLLLGIPGTGKSLAAKAIGNLWQMPLLRLDMGKIFGNFIGDSERNIRESLNIAEAIAPSILWIDEIEKAMSGLSASGFSEGGTTSRVLGTFLTWMQEKQKPVFVFATANSLSLPPEMLRKGRFDEIFFVDLPVEKERAEILAIHIRNKNRDPQNFDIKKLAGASKNFSGAELEEVIKEAMFQAYNDNKREMTDDDILKAISKTYPLSWVMRTEIAGTRDWAKNRAISASSEVSENLSADTEE